MHKVSRLFPIIIFFCLNIVQILLASYSSGKAPFQNTEVTSYRSKLTTKPIFSMLYEGKHETVKQPSLHFRHQDRQNRVTGCIELFFQNDNVCSTKYRSYILIHSLQQAEILFTVFCWFWNSLVSILNGLKCGSDKQ